MFLMANIKDLAVYIGAMRSRCARARQFDLCHSKAEHDNDPVNEALQICRQAQLKASLSVSGERCRRYYARADDARRKRHSYPISWLASSPSGSNYTWCPRFTKDPNKIIAAEYAALEALLCRFRPGWWKFPQRS